MAFVKPFKAVRPAKEKVSQVTSNSFQMYSIKEREKILQSNPFSFLHIINSGYQTAKRISSTDRFKRVAKSYQNFLRTRVLVRDQQACFYVYKILRKNASCCGFICATSTQDYEKDLIRKHEATIARREVLFANYLETVRFNAEPVLITYPPNNKLAEILQAVTQSEYQYKFTTTKKSTHILWKLEDKALIDNIQKAFKDLDALYIADGHHRSASSSLLARNLKNKNPNHTGNEAYNYFMSYLIPETEVRIFEFNRMVKDLNGLSCDEFLKRLKRWYTIKKTGPQILKQVKKHQFSMYLAGESYTLTLKEAQYSFTDALSRLDTQILYKTILEPLLGIRDLRNDKRIRYGYGKHNLVQMKEAIDLGSFAIGFSLVPMTIDEIKAIADAGLVMPPKSTYIEPKLLSGLTIYEF